MLHEIGLAISMSGAHKHGAYIVEHADLGGFTTREQRMLSTLVLGQKGNLRKIRETLVEADLAKAVLALRLAIVLMHARADDDIGACACACAHVSTSICRAELMRKPPDARAMAREGSAGLGEVGVPFQASACAVTQLADHVRPGHEPDDMAGRPGLVLDPEHAALADAPVLLLPGTAPARPVTQQRLVTHDQRRLAVRPASRRPR